MNNPCPTYHVHKDDLSGNLKRHRAAGFFFPAAKGRDRKIH